MLVGAPASYPASLPDATRMVHPGADGSETPGRWTGFTRIRGSPACDRAIDFHPTRMLTFHAYRDECSRRREGLAEGIVPPTDNGAVSLHAASRRPCSSRGRTEIAESARRRS